MNGSIPNWTQWVIKKKKKGQEVRGVARQSGVDFRRVKCRNDQITLNAYIKFSKNMYNKEIFSSPKLPGD